MAELKLYVLLFFVVLLTIVVGISVFLCKKNQFWVFCIATFLCSLVAFYFMHTTLLIMTSMFLLPLGAYYWYSGQGKSKDEYTAKASTIRFNAFILGFLGFLIGFYPKGLVNSQLRMLFVSVIYIQFILSVGFLYRLFSKNENLFTTNNFIIISAVLLPILTTAKPGNKMTIWDQVAVFIILAVVFAFQLLNVIFENNPESKSLTNKWVSVISKAFVSVVFLVLYGFLFAFPVIVSLIDKPANPEANLSNLSAIVYLVCLTTLFFIPRCKALKTDTSVK